MNPESIKKLCVTGAGQMGSQIALLGALAGLDVALHDISDEQLERAQAGNREQLDRRVAKGKLEQQAVDDALARFTATSSLEEACRGADFVIEAVVEILDIKRQVSPSSTA